ncbi:MAG: hypothetical protein ABW139_02405 [Candidatus Thiodiazotropha sp. DIVDIV]
MLQRRFDALPQAGALRLKTTYLVAGLIVPRSRESWQGISVNALGYAGSLFVFNHSAVEKLCGFGPLNLLKEVSYTH